MILFACLGVLMALAYRSVQGQMAVAKFRQGSQAYQGSDQAAEFFLQKLRSVDNDSNRDFENMIPQNIPAHVFCREYGATCFDGDVALTDAADLSLSEVDEIKASASSASTVRAVRAPLPLRVDFGQRLGDISFDAASGHATLTWTVPAAVAEEVGGFEIRRARSDEPGRSGRAVESAGTDINDNETKAGELLRNADVKWRHVALVAVDSGVDEPGSLRKYTYVDTEAGRFEAGSVAAYAIKATNKKPLMLDSLYTAPKAVKIERP
jgi:hypothetical protein